METTGHTERSILDRLNKRYGYTGGNGFRYARAEHVRNAAGFDANRTCDYMALDLWNGGYGVGRGPKLHGHEVKCSRSDWLTELRDPSKADEFARYCDYWWLVVSDRAIVKPGELPDGWGLLAVGGRGLSAVTPAPLRTPEPMGRQLYAGFSRAVVKTTVRLGVVGDAPVADLVRDLSMKGVRNDQ